MVYPCFYHLNLFVIRYVKFFIKHFINIHIANVYMYIVYIYGAFSFVGDMAFSGYGDVPPIANTTTYFLSRLVAASCQALLILAFVPLAPDCGRWDSQKKDMCSSVLHVSPADKFLYCGKTILYCGQILVLQKDDFVL